jgi:cell division protein ZapA
MADLDLNVAGRSYRVAVEDGQEAALAEAGALISAEAETLRRRFGARFATLPESRVLLLAGLMVADKARGAAAARAEAPPPEPAPPAPEGAEPGGEPVQTALFEDPVQAERIAELEARLAEAEAAEAAALSALEDATRRIREMAAELTEEEA